MNGFWLGFLIGFITAPFLILIVIILLVLWWMHKKGIPFAH